MDKSKISPPPSSVKSGDVVSGKGKKRELSVTPPRIFPKEPTVSGFKVKPLNQPVIPRQQWTSHRLPTAKRRELQDLTSVVRGVEDLDVAASRLQRQAEKLRESKIKEKADKKGIVRDKLGTRIVNERKAIVVRSPKRTQNGKSYIDRFEPQMFSRSLSMPGGWFSPNITLDLGSETLSLGEELTESLKNVSVEHKIALDQSAKEASDKLTTAVEGLTEAISNPSVTFDLGSKAAGAVSVLGDLGLFVLVVVLLIMLKPHTKTEKTYAMSLVMVLLATRFDLMSIVQRSGILSWLSPSEKVEPQFGFDIVDNTMNDLPAMMASLLNTYLMASFGKDLLDPKEFLRVTSQISRSTPTVVNTMAGIQLILSLIGRTCDKLFRGEDFVKTGYPFIDAYWKEYKEIVDAWESKELLSRQSSVDRVKAHIALGEHTYMRMPASGQFGSIRMALMNSVRELEKIRTALMSSNFKYAGVRPEPVSMLMLGRPGVFKSQAMQHVAHAINARILSDDEYERYKEAPTSWVFNRQAENVYWDGYSMDKTVVFFDDLLQARDIQGQPDNEAMNVIRAINIFENKLHMAELKDKGTTNFRSKFVIANSNAESFNLESIVEIGAFMRRWDVVVRVVPKVEYSINPDASARSRRFDPSKFPKFTEETCGGHPELIGTTCTDPEMCEFHVLKYDESVSKNSFQDAGIILSFDEMVKKYVDYYKMKQMYDTGYVVRLDNTLKRHREFKKADESMGQEEEVRDKFEPESGRGFNIAIDPVEGENQEVDMRIDFTIDSASGGNSVDVANRLMNTPIDFLSGLPSNVALSSYGEEIMRRSPKNIGFLLFVLEQFQYMPRYDVEYHMTFMANVLEAYFEVVHGEPVFDLTQDVVPDHTPTQMVDVLQFALKHCSADMSPGHTDKREFVKYLVAPPVDCKYPDGSSPRYPGDYDDVEKESPRLAEFYKTVPFLVRTRFDHCSDEYWSLLENCVYNELSSRSDEVVYGESGQYILPGNFPFKKTLDVFVEKLRSYPEVFSLVYYSEEGVHQWVPQTMNASVALDNANAKFFREQFSLTEDRYNVLEYLKLTNIQRYLLLYHGFTCAMTEAFLSTDEELIPNLVFDEVHHLSANLEKYLQKNTLYVELLAEEAIEAYRKRTVDKTFRPSEDCKKLLKEMSDLYDVNKTGVLGKLHSLYIDCLLYLGVSGAETGDALLQPIIANKQLRATLGSMAAIGGAAIVFMRTAKMFARILFPNEPNSHVRHDRVRRTRVARRPKPTLKPESALASNMGLRSAKKMLYKNSMFELYVPLPKDERTNGKDMWRAGYCLGVAGNCILLPWHFYSVVGTYLDDGVIDGSDFVALYKAGSKDKIFQFTAAEFFSNAVLWDKGEELDLIMVRLPKQFQPLRNIAKHFATEKQHKRYTKVDGMLFIPGRITEEDEPSINFVHAIAERNRDIDSDDFDSYRVHEVYEYAANTSFGDCGAVLFVDDVQGAGCVIGMHVAGSPSTRRGFSAKITREFIEKYLELAKEDYLVEDIDDLVEPSNSEIATMRTLGKARPEIATPSGQSFTNLRASIIKDKVLPSPNAPARLRPFERDGEIIDPMDVALRGYCPGFTYIDPEVVQEANDAFFDHLNHVSTKDVERKIMTFEEAVLGDGPGSEFGPIPRDTSAGYPYNCMGAPTSKKRFFGDDEEYDLSLPACEELKSLVADIEAKARRNIRCLHVFTDSLKDERRPKEKVAIGKTRMFSGSPTPLLILTRQYFGAFSKWMIRNRVLNGIAIGVNEYSSEWDLIGRKLEKFGSVKNIGAGDFSGLDKAELPIFHQAILEGVNKWYNDGDENARVRKILLLELTNSVHVNRGVFYEWVMSMPSGHFLTALFNSCTVHLLFRCCFVVLMRDRNFRAHDFNDFVWLIVLGDDNVYSVHPKLTELLNEVEIGKAMSLFGQTYTPEDKLKGVHTREMRGLKDVSFLKRKWYEHEATTRLMAPLDLHTVLDILNWVKKGGNQYGDVETNIDTVLHELTLHGRSVFSEWSAKIFDVVRSTPGLQLPKVTTFDVLFRDVLRRDGWEYEGVRRFRLDYDGLSGQTTDIQAQCGRLSEERGDLFRSYITRTPRWQPQSSPGNRSSSSWLPHLLLPYQRGADSNIQEIPGENSEGIVNTVRADGGASDVQVGATKSYVETGVVKATPVYTPLNSEVLSVARSSTSQELKDFLAKPMFVSGGTLTATDLVTVSKWEYLVPNNVLSFDVWKNKIQGTAAFRGSLHITMQINANRFQQGRYIIAWIPTGGGINYAPKVAAHSATLTELTQCPHVEFDLNCDSEATIVIPHVNVQGWSVSTGSSFGSVGVVKCIPYSPLVAPSGSTTCNYSLYMHWEDVEIAMPIVPQSGRVKTKIRRKPGVAEIEQQAGSIGPIEAGATVVSKVAGVLTGVPLLSSVAGPVAWASDVVKGIAAAYGWSRPRNLAPDAYVTRQQMHRMTNVDAPDNSSKLAFFDRNELEELPDFAGTGMDEMSINHIASISSYWRTYTWNTSQIAGVSIAKIPITPRGFFNTTALASQTVTHVTPVAFVSRFFAKWRGSINVTFKLVKTEFHSGRLLAAFQVYDPRFTNYNDPTLTSTVWTHRQIVDVRSGNEFTINIPWIAFSQYKPTYGSMKIVGYLHLFVQNPLVAPSTVSSTVPILTEVSAGPDFELAQPCQPSGTPTIQWTPQIGNRNECQMVSSTIGGAQDTERDVSSRVCIGERVLSFRSILKRFCNLRPRADYAGSATNRVVGFGPFMVHVDQFTSTPAYLRTDYEMDLFDHIAPCYALFRGGMRFKFIITDSTTDNNWSAYATAIPEGGGFDRDFFFTTVAANSGDPTKIVNRSQAFFRSDTTGGLEVEYPFYSDYHSAAVCDMLCVATSTTPSVRYVSASTAPSVSGYVQSHAPATATIVPPSSYRAIGEDASLGLFVSTISLVGYDPDFCG